MADTNPKKRSEMSEEEKLQADLAKIEEMEKKARALKAEAQRKKAKLAQKEKKKETSQLIILGRLFKKLVDDGKFSKDEYAKELDGFLTREYDRKLFNLPD